MQSSTSHLQLQIHIRCFNVFLGSHSQFRWHWLPSGINFTTHSYCMERAHKSVHLREKKMPSRPSWDATCRASVLFHIISLYLNVLFLDFTRILRYIVYLNSFLESWTNRFVFMRYIYVVLHGIYRRSCVCCWRRTHFLHASCGPYFLMTDFPWLVPYKSIIQPLTLWNMKSHCKQHIDQMKCHLPMLQRVPVTGRRANLWSRRAKFFARAIHSSLLTGSSVHRLSGH